RAVPRAGAVVPPRPDRPRPATLGGPHAVGRDPRRGRHAGFRPRPRRRRRPGGRRRLSARPRDPARLPVPGTPRRRARPGYRTVGRPDVAAAPVGRRPGGGVPHVSPLPANVLWPAAALGDALAAVARVSGRRHPGRVDPPPAEAPEVVARWVEAAADSLGIEAEPVTTRHADVAYFLARSAPLPGAVPA